MKGLLLKDLLNLKQVMKLWFIIGALWCAVGAAQHDSGYVGGMMMMLVTMVPFNAMAYDEQAKWERYALTLPVRHRDLVVSKYLLSLLCGAISAVMVLTCSLLMGEGLAHAASLTCAMLGAGLMASALVLPLLFKFGVQKGRLAMFGVLLVYFIAAGLFTQLGIKLPHFPEKGLWLLLPAALILFALSCELAVRLYRRKEF